MLLRKGVICYEIIDFWKTFKETLLPTKEKFISKLSNKEISDEGYRHVQREWNKFNIKNLGEYLDLHNMGDVLVLLGVVGDFDKNMFEKFGLVSLNFVTLDLYS